MKLYVGGAFQGKKAYVDNEYSEIKTLKWFDGKDCVEKGSDYRTIADFDAVCNYHEVIRKELLDGVSPEDELDLLLKDNPELIIVCDEVGCGVIPISKEDRMYREAVGRCMCIAASKADKVTRIICGIGQVIKC